MAKVNWSWKPPKLPARAKLDGAIRVQGSPRSTVPHVEQKTEKAQTGGWGQGTGANVSATMCGVNNAHDKVMQAIGGRVNAHFKALRRAKRAARVARLQAMGR